MATVTGRWLVGTQYRETLGADDPPGSEPKGDFIYSGPGNDYLLGDIGADVFGFMPGSGQDFIDKFTPGEDKIQFAGGLTMASLIIEPITVAGRSGLAVYYSGRGGPDALFLADVTALQPNDIEFGPLPGTYYDPPAQDFDGNFRSDLVVRTSDGAVTEWRMNGAAVASKLALANPGTDWKVIASDDFLGDWDIDMLFQHQDGRPVIWNLKSSGIEAPVNLPDPGPQWHAFGTGHFDDDPAADILFQHDNGDVAIWLMGTWQQPDGTINASGVVASPGPEWTIAGTGDFDGDFKTDILFRHADGRLVEWRMDGLKIAGDAVIGTLPNGAAVVGAADFDANGRDEILVRQADGTLAMWAMSGLTATGATTIRNPGEGWKVVGTGDYDGNGKADIMLQNTEGALELWRMDGARIVAEVAVTQTDAGWFVA